ncbi:MAG: deoxyribose-phosphate aldolase [Rhodothermales bacterium]
MDEQETRELIERVHAELSSGGGTDERSPDSTDRRSPDIKDRRARELPEQQIRRAIERRIGEGAVRANAEAGDRGASTEDGGDWDRALAGRIDHTALGPATSIEEIEWLCGEARRYRFASVCVPPCYVEMAAAWLTGEPVAVCTVVGFPLGTTHPEAKVRESVLAAGDGATEIDMVLNVGMLKSHEFGYVGEDIRAVVRAVQHRGILVKVILETGLLTDEEKVAACILAQRAGADFVKTSTGFSSGGATARDVELMRRVVGDSMGVKAAGGIRTAQDARRMLEHGASRIGASASVAIVQS